VTKVTRRGLTRRLGEASNTVSALTGFLHHVANLLRQLVHVVGWLILLASAVNLLVHPHLSPPELFVPGAGSLAVLQSLVKPCTDRRTRAQLARPAGRRARHGRAGTCRIRGGHSP